MASSPQFLTIGLLLATGFVHVEAQLAPADTARDPVSVAIAHFNRGEMETAEKIIEAHLAKDQKAALAWNVLARIHHSKKRWPEAIQAFTKATELEPKNGSMLQNLGISYFEDSQVALAKKTLERALELDPLLPLGQIYLGRIAQEAGDMPEAARHFEAAAQSSPEDPWPHYFLGLLRFKEKDLKSAERALRTCLEKSPDLFAAHWNLWLVLGRLDKKDEAAHHLEKFRRLSDVVLEDTQKRLRVAARVHGAQEEMKAGRMDTAYLYLNEARAMAPEHPLIYLLLAEVHARRGDKSEAEKARKDYERLKNKGKG